MRGRITRAERATAEYEKFVRQPKRRRRRVGAVSSAVTVSYHTRDCPALLAHDHPCTCGPLQPP